MMYLGARIYYKIYVVSNRQRKMEALHRILTGFILLEVLLKPGSPYFGGTPKARQPLFFWRYS